MGGWKRIQVFKIWNGVYALQQPITQFMRNLIYGTLFIFIYSTSQPIVTETKFLGVVFNRKPTFFAYNKYLKDRCLKAVTLLRVVAHKDWGGQCNITQTVSNARKGKAWL